ncbi:MAG: DNA polymerase II [Acidobacteria bacterium]|nr:DNA polymerase II [Acidobacteriota bacterium]
MSARGFVLHPTYRLEAGRPVVLLYGKLEDGRTFLVRDTRQVPRFFVRAADAEWARALGARPLEAAGKTNFAGEAVVRVELAVPADAPALRERLAAAGIECCEADVRFAARLLIDHRIRGSLAITGEERAAPGGGVIFDDPELAPADWTPSLSVLSIDIETDPSAEQVLSIALYGCGGAEVLLLDAPGGCPPGATPCPGERELLATFCRRVRELDPDVITGWNVIDFDFAVLARRAARLGVLLELGRGPGPLRVDASRVAWGTSRCTVTGRMVLDGLDLVRGAFLRFDEHSLDFVARQVLGEGKLFSGPDRFEQILRTFREDRPRFVEYNLRDARLALEILQKLRLVELAVERSRLTGVPLDRVAASVAAFDFLYLSELARRGVVAPTARPASDPSPNEEAGELSGGYVLEPAPGLYRNVVVFDFKSLYPSIIRTFQIDPLGHLRAPTPDADPIVAPNGAAFRRAPGILPGLLDELMPKREAARAAGDKTAAHAIKILMNSFYGVLGTPACRFHSAELSNAITSFGREILLWTKARVEARGFAVLYGDTDSLFVATGESDAAAARAVGARLADELTAELGEHVARTWRVASRLQLVFETLYLRLLLPVLRRGAGGARKRYAGLVEEDGVSRVVFTGLEVVRRDWTDLAKSVQKELYRRLFAEQPVQEYLRDTVADLRAGRLNDLLVYRKALRKGVDEYTAATPPHVAAARKLGGALPRVIAYVVTVAGPEPATALTSPVDYEHYVDKQVRAVAEPVLAILHLDFDKVIGDDRQLDLF